MICMRFETHLYGLLCPAEVQNIHHLLADRLTFCQLAFGSCLPLSDYVIESLHVQQAGLDPIKLVASLQ